MSTPLLVTGASGHLGRKVLDLLLEQKAGPIIATTRNPDTLKDYAARGVEVRKADFDDPASLAAAFKGAGRALLISTDSIDRPGRRAEQHQQAIKALEAAGVRHVVYTSIVNPTVSKSVGPDHTATEAALTASKLDFTVLRNSVYADMLLMVLPTAMASGQLVNARGQGKVAFITRDDCARAAAAALAGSATGRQVIDVTGPEAITSDDLVRIAGELGGKKLTHVSVPTAAMVEGLVKHAGMPLPVAQFFGVFDDDIASNALSSKTDEFQKLTGRAPTTVGAFLTATKAVWASAPAH